MHAELRSPWMYAQVAFWVTRKYCTWNSCWDLLLLGPSPCSFPQFYWIIWFIKQACYNMTRNFAFMPWYYYRGRNRTPHPQLIKKCGPSFPSTGYSFTHFNFTKSLLNILSLYQPPLLYGIYYVLSLHHYQESNCSHRQSARRNRVTATGRLLPFLRIIFRWRFYHDS
jgi:hypothetical protein